MTPPTPDQPDGRPSPAGGPGAGPAKPNKNWRYAYAVAIVADQLRQSQQPLVPSQLIHFGGGEGGQSSSMLGALLSLLATEKLGIEVNPKQTQAAPVGDA